MKERQTKINIHPGKRRAILAILAVAGIILTSSIGTAQDSIIALGRVNSLGGLSNSANTIGAVVGSSRIVEGNYAITVTGAGAFAGTVAADYVVETTISSGVSNDEAIRASVGVTDNILTITVNTDDVEDSANTSSWLSNDASFFFVVRRIPSSGMLSPDSRYLIASGNVDSTGSLNSGVGIGNIEIASDRIATGHFEIILSKEGGFADDATYDYVMTLTTFGGPISDEGIRGSGPSGLDIFSSNNARFTVRVNELQDEADDDVADPSNRDFYFSIYRIPAGSDSGKANSNLVVGLATFSGTGIVNASASSLPGAEITCMPLGSGSYEVTLTSPGAFAGKTGNSYVAHVNVNENTSSDHVAVANIEVPDADTMQVNIGINDVENTGESNGVGENAPFHLGIFDAVGILRPDLRIGTKKNPNKMKGNDRYNNSGGGQQVRLDLPGTTKKKFYFALENDGNIVDSVRIRETGAGNRLNTRYFKLTGGRKNVTAKITTAGLEETRVAPARILRFEGQANYKSENGRPMRKVRVKARSLYQPSLQDTTRVKTVGK